MHADTSGTMPASTDGRLLPERPIDLLIGGYHIAGAAVEDRVDSTVVVVSRFQRQHLRDDVTPDEQASYCLHSVAAANRMPSKDAVLTRIRSS